MRLTLGFVAARGVGDFCCGAGTGGSEEETGGFPPDAKRIPFSQVWKFGYCITFIFIW